MCISSNWDCLQKRQPWTRHELPIAPLPGIGNISGNDSGNISGNKIGNISGNKIGKSGNVVRLLTITQAAGTAPRSPEKTSTRANHPTLTTAPATFPAKNRQHPRQCLRQQSYYPTRPTLRSLNWGGAGERLCASPPASHESKTRKCAIFDGSLASNTAGNKIGNDSGNISGNDYIATCHMPLFVKSRSPILTFPLSHLLPGMFLTCAGTIAHSSTWQ
ncbi:MAG TPA: hypothetical protein VF510_26615 [Ktedonobacterales bacterium]